MKSGFVYERVNDMLPQSFLKKECGASLVEGALVIAFLALTAVAAANAVGSNTYSVFCKASLGVDGDVAGATKGGKFSTGCAVVNPNSRGGVRTDTGGGGGTVSEGW
ncbi:MAG: hypothetical protein D6719_08270 [Candidatus Dadabacteria bacterium]|nr:MAG: hypothetical protein D6719_08270 [Candidatus Dadabacteria bacterium]